jgi:hypothetical protein
MKTLFALIGTVIAACASTPVPTESLAASTASARAADEVGAHNVPSAALHLQLAQEQIEQARKLMKDDHNERARYVLMRAQADAELAVVEAREDDMRTEAQRAMDQVHALQQQRP